MRKTLLVASASIFVFCVLVIAAKAATTWQGPPTNCTSPEGSNCNTNGVIWNQTTQQNPANFNVSGNGQTGGSLTAGTTLTAGTGLIVNSGGANITGTTRIFNADTFISNGNLYFETDNKAIHVNQAGTSHLKIGNWNKNADTKVEMTLFGDLKIYKEDGGNYTPKLYASNICLGPQEAETCITAWPGSGGGGTVTSITAGSGLSASPTSPISNAGTLNVNTGAGLTINGSNQIVPNYTVMDERYTLKAGDTMTGKLTINTPAIGDSGITVNTAGSSVRHGIEVTVTGVGAYALKAKSNSVAVYGDGTMDGGYFTSAGTGVTGISTGANAGGSFISTNGYGVIGETNNAGAFGGYFYNSVNGNSLYVAGYNESLIVNGKSRLVGDVAIPANLTVYGAASKITSSNYCIGVSCITAWPGVSNGKGITSTGGSTPTLALDTTYTDERYVNSSGDTMTGDLSLGGTRLWYNGGTGSYITINSSIPASVLFSARNTNGRQYTQAWLAHQNFGANYMYANETGTILTEAFDAHSTAAVFGIARFASGAAGARFSILNANGGSDKNVYLANASYAIDASGPVQITGDVTITGSASDLAVGGEMTAPNNRFGTAGTNYSTAPCVLETNLYNAGKTYRRGCLEHPGFFMAGIEYSNTSPYAIQGVWCCPL